MSDNDVILHGRSLVKSYGRPPAHIEVLHGVDLDVRTGEFVAVMGPSGCGKSTLLHLLGLMSRPDSGELSIRGRNMLTARESERIKARRRALGFVFQRFNLLGMLTARDNLATSLRVRGMPADDGQIDTLLERMGVAHVARRKACKMSIGEQQRVAISRAVAHSPAILLADEPTGNLDSVNAEAVLELFRSANRDDGQTILMITHSAEAAGWADRVLHMRDGRIHDTGA